MATKMNWKSFGRRTLSILLAIMMVVGMVGTAFAQGTSSDPYDVGDIVYTANQNTKPSGAIPALTKWEFQKTVYNCGKEAHTHGMWCRRCTKEEHTHSSDCGVQAQWKLVENQDTALHLDIHIALTATYILDGVSYTADVELTKEDYTSGNLSITADVPFTITGTEIYDAGQRRFNGSFPVGTSDDPVYYTISLTKNVDFDVNGETVSIPMTFENTVQFWSSDNICETIMQSRDKSKWLAGEFIRGGMDFQLGASSATGSTAPTDATLTIQKNVAGVTLAETKTFTFDIYSGTTKVDTVDITVAAGGTVAIGTTVLDLNETYYVVEEGVPSIEGYSLTTTVDGKSGVTSDSFTLTGDKAVVFTNTYAADPVYFNLTVNYVDLDGNVIADQIVENDKLEGSAYTTQQKTIEGYTFEKTEGDAVSGIMDSDKVVTYVYSKNPDPTYAITYRVEGDAPATSSAIPAGETGILAGESKTVEPGLTTTETTKNGVVGTWTFNGWTTSDASVKNGAFEMPGNDVEFIGTWTFVAAPLYDITYRVEGDAPATSSAIPAGETGILAGASKNVEAGLTTTETTKNGVVGTWTFNGWTTSDASVKNGAFEMPGNDVEFIGTWTFVAAPLYDIAYRVEGDAPATSSAIPAGETGILAGASKNVESGLTTTEATKNGVVGTWTFNGWTTSDASIENGAFEMPGSDVEFVGTWTFVAAPTYGYSVVAEYYTNNNLDASKSLDVVDGVLQLPTETAVENTYSAVNVENNGVTYTYTSISKSGNVYTLRYDRATYEISYRVEGDVPESFSAIPSSEAGVEAGTSKTVKADLTTTETTKAGLIGAWIFNGWTTADATIQNGNFEMPGNDVEFVGNWTFVADRFNYYVAAEYYTNGVKDHAELVSLGTVLGVNAIPTTDEVAEVYSALFTGYNGNVYGYTGISYNPNTFVLRYDRTTYEISYRVEGDAPAISSTIPAGETGILAGETKSVESGLTTTETTKNGVVGTWIFNGWTTSDASVKNGAFEMPGNDVEFIGTWTFVAAPTYTVTVYRVDEAGNNLLAPVSVSGMYSGMSYSSSLKAIEGYAFQKMAKDSDPASGAITDRDIVVIYVYEKLPDPTYTVTVYRVDEAGNDLLAPASVSGMKSGMSYSSSLKTIEGYTFKEMAETSDPASGTIADRDIVVIYVYSKDEVVVPPTPTYDYTVVAEYYTNDSKDGGKNIASVVDVLALPTADEVADTYKAGNTDYNGETYTYTGVTKSGNIYTLRYDRTYVAPSLYTLQVRWLSEDGDVLAKQMLQIKKEGSEYSTQQKSIEGYIFVRTEGDAVSGIMDDNKSVTYIYSKDVPVVPPVDPVDPPVDPVDPPVDPVDPPVDPVDPPVDPVDPPVDPVDPPVDPVDPPVDPVDPPVDPVDPPVDPIDPPVDPVDPPVDPVDPPVDPVDPPVDPVEPPVDPVDPEDPEDPIDIPDDDVPLVDVPQTGDLSVLWMAMTGAAAAGLIGLGVTRKKKDEE